MLSRRYQTARSTIESHRPVALGGSMVASEQMVLQAKAKLLDVADRLHEMQHLLRVTSREESEARATGNGKSSTSFELLSFNLSNAPEESLSLSPLSITSPFPDAANDDELTSLLPPVPSGLVSIPDVRYITEGTNTQFDSTTIEINDSEGRRKKTAVVFVPIIKNIANDFEGCVFDKEAVQTQRTRDGFSPTASSPDGWSDDELSDAEENVHAQRLRVSNSRGDLLGRCSDLANNELASFPVHRNDHLEEGLAVLTSTVVDEEWWSDEDPCLLDEAVSVRLPRVSNRGSCVPSFGIMEDDSGWQDEPSFLLNENISNVKKTGKKVKVPPLNLLALPSSPVQVEAAPMKSSHRLLRFASARSTDSITATSSFQSVLDLCDSLDVLSDELMDNARGSRVFADTMHAKVLRLTDDISRAHTRYTELVAQLEELERGLGASLATFQQMPELKTPSMSPTPLVGGSCRQRGRPVMQVLAAVEPSPLSEKALNHARDVSNMTTQVNSPTATHDASKMVENGNDVQSPLKSLWDIGTVITPMAVRDDGTSPVCTLQRDFACLVKPSQSDFSCLAKPPQEEAACLAKPSRMWQQRPTRTLTVQSLPHQRRLTRQWTHVRRLDQINAPPKNQSLAESWQWFKSLILRATIECP